jgi:type IV pilus assembly protein PilO
MDLKDPKTQKLLLGGLVIVLVIYFWYAKIYSKNTVVIQQKQTRYENLMSNLKNVELKAKSYESLKEEYHRLVDRYRRVERLLPEERQIPLFMMQMHSAAASYQTGIIQILPKDPVGVGFYNASSFDVEAAGSYHNFGGFLSDIANFPFLANVSNMTITAIPQDGLSPEQKGQSITASFKLTTYYVKEEERLKEIEF